MSWRHCTLVDTLRNKKKVLVFVPRHGVVQDGTGWRVGVLKLQLFLD
jgi:hypothetical protein